MFWLITMKSADLPGSTLPVSSSFCKAIAPFLVKIWIAVSMSTRSFGLKRPNWGLPGYMRVTIPSIPTHGFGSGTLSQSLP